MVCVCVSERERQTQRLKYVIATCHTLSILCDANYWLDPVRGLRKCREVVDVCIYGLEQRSPTGGPRENFCGPWRNLDIAVTSLVPRIHKLISNKQQQISH
jgi:hypothetical protein